jgi:exoribonuclease II
MPGFISDSLLARELIRIGDKAIAAEDDAKLRAYFAADYVFHGTRWRPELRSIARVLRVLTRRFQRSANRP